MIDRGWPHDARTLTTADLPTAMVHPDIRAEAAWQPAPDEDR